MVLPTWFHTPPPSEAAKLAPTVPPVMVIVAAPDTCSAPPFPGFGLPAVPLTSLKALVVFVMVSVPSIISIPPPALLALFRKICTSEILTSPAVLNTPPPEPEVPVARLLFTKVPFTIESVPPLLKIPPPPLSASFPLEVLLFTSVASTVIVPALFHSPPPSEAARLLVTVAFVIMALVVPERCSAPPFPGLAMAPRPMSTPAEFPSRIIPSKVRFVPEASSIAPPARLA